MRVNGRPAVPHFRLWLLLHHLSQQENTSGNVDEEATRRELTNPKSPFYIGSKRYLRRLLADGDGIFWERGRSRIWLHGIGRVCRWLEIERLSGQPVEIPVEKLCGSITEVRAWLMVAFLGGRKDQERPIARATIKKVTGVGRRTQRKYMRATRTRVVKNTAVLGPYSPHALQRAQIHLGLPAYRRKGEIHYRMANSYKMPACVQQVGNGRTKAINRRLDHCDSPGGGNGRQFSRWYYDDAKAACLAWERGGGREVYGRRSRRRWVVFIGSGAELF